MPRFDSEKYSIWEIVDEEFAQFGWEDELD
jgi:hypothetical protein